MSKISIKSGSLGKDSLSIFKIEEVGERLRPPYMEDAGFISYFSKIREVFTDKMQETFIGFFLF